MAGVVWYGQGNAYVKLIIAQPWRMLEKNNALPLPWAIARGGGSWLCASDLFVCQHNCRVIATLKLQFAVTSRNSVRQYD